MQLRRVHEEREPGYIMAARVSASGQPLSVAEDPHLLVI